MKVAITGKPGVGKSTLCLKVFERLGDRKRVTGFITKEVREKGQRVGFEIVDLKTGQRWVLARKEEGEPKVGKYRVYVENVDVMAEKLSGLSDDFDLLILDEFGPMELKSRKFVHAVEELLNSDLNMIFTVHYRSNHPLVGRIKREFVLFTLTEENRDEIFQEVLELIDN